MSESNKRQVFFSFHYDADAWRASQVRNMGVVDKSSTFCDNDWEEVKKKSKEEIKEWINSQMKMRSCLVVLIGEQTWQREWVKYEIELAYKLRKGIVGIYIHKLKDRFEMQANEGISPFDVVFTEEENSLANYALTFNSEYSESNEVYNDIKEKIHDLIEGAIEKAKSY